MFVRIITRFWKVLGISIIAVLFWLLPGCSSDGKSPSTSSASASSVISVSSSSAQGISSSQAISSSQSSISSEPSGLVEVSPNDPAIRYVGRVAVTAEAALYDWAGIQIEFKVEASSVELLLEDGDNDYNLFVDGVLQQVLSTVSSESIYPVALGGGEHLINLTKRTGPNFGSGRFLGLRLPSGGRLLTQPARSSRKIEFIGDSYTVGYGNEGPGLDCSGVYRPYENSYQSFAAITARAMAAEGHLVAISGFGAVRNYGDPNSTSATPMPSFYGRTLMTRADLLWDFQAWVPDSVVIKLGANDHSTQPEPAESVFIQGIHDLIAQVNTAYGSLPIFLVADSSLSQLVARMQSAATEQHSMGNSQVHFVQLSHPPQSQLGCDYHPLVVGHQAMANELVASMESVLGWQAASADSVSVTAFKGGAKGAYSIILDDYCATWTSGIDQFAIPSLIERDLRVGLGAIGAECERNNYQSQLKNAADLGFEIVNHTWTHPALVQCDSAPNPGQQCADVRPDFAEEIDKTRLFLEEASGTSVTFFIFPFNSVDNVVLNHLRDQHYLGARGGSYSINPADFSDPFTLNLQGYQQDLNSYPNQAVASGAFAFRNLHGIADESFETVPLAQWHEHLDYIKILSDRYDLWVDTPTAIVRYSRSKALCGIPVIENGVLTFVGALPGCEEYVTGLTVNVIFDDELTGLSPMQNNVTLDTRELTSNSWLIENVDPRFATELNAIK